MNLRKEKYSDIKDFLFSYINKEFFIFLFFLTLSTAFWCMLTLNETYEREIPIRIQMNGVPDNVVITDPLPDTVKVVVKDKGYILWTYLYGDALRPVKVSFSHLKKNSEQGNISTAELTKLISATLYTSTKIVVVKADKLTFTFNYGQSKRVPVLLDGQIKTADTYYLSNTTISPESVTVYASPNTLKKLKEVYTEKIIEEEIADTVTRRIRLRSIHGAKIVPDEVTVTFHADVLTEKIIDVPISAFNTPEGFALRTFPTHVPVKVVCGRSVLNTIRSENFIVGVDYLNVASQPSDRCTITLKRVPKGIVSATLETQQVDYLIEKIE